MYGLDRDYRRRSARPSCSSSCNSRISPRRSSTDYSHGMQKKLALAAAVIHGPKILFLDEPFEGVDAIASGTLKAMLQHMIERGATIFLTSHVLEIVERLCSHVAIIHRGRLVAQGSIEDLRRGVEAQAAAAGRRGGADFLRRKPDARRNFSAHRGRSRPGGAGALVAGVISAAEARGQFAAIARVRWQIFANSLRTLRGRLEMVSRGFLSSVSRPRDSAERSASALLRGPSCAKGASNCSPYCCGRCFCSGSFFP